MMQAHRHWHLFLWMLLGPTMLVIVWLAVTLRPPAAINDSLPQALTPPAAQAIDE
ncbi:MAG: hypothetical protein AAGA68_14210 [Pseudomonadota bacterium]